MQVNVEIASVLTMVLLQNDTDTRHMIFFPPLSLLYFAQFQQIGFATLQELRAAEGKANVCH